MAKKKQKPVPVNVQQLQFIGMSNRTKEELAEIETLIDAAHNPVAVFQFVSKLAVYFDTTSVLLILRAAQDTKIT